MKVSILLWPSSVERAVESFFWGGKNLCLCLFLCNCIYNCIHTLGTLLEFMKIVSREEGFVGRIPSWSHIFFQQYHVFISCKITHNQKRKSLRRNTVRNYQNMRYYVSYTFLIIFLVKKSRKNWPLHKPLQSNIFASKIDSNVQITKHIGGRLVNPLVWLWCTSCYRLF